MKNHVKMARLFATLMDNQFKVLGVGFGLDNILGLVPGIGDLLSFALSFYLIWIGFKMELPSEKLSQMVKNILVDALIGSIPVVGDFGDLFFKANMKNLRIIEEFDDQVVEGEVIA